MARIEIRDAAIADAAAIRKLAEDTWWPTYAPIISNEQITYMLAELFNDRALRDLIDSGQQRFLILAEDDVPTGFAAHGPRPGNAAIHKLHKLYVLPSAQGKGFGRLMLGHVTRHLVYTGVRYLDLNVNRNNPAVKFYERIGFSVLREEDIAIGPYWMNDFVMRYALDSGPIA